MSTEAPAANWEVYHGDCGEQMRAMDSGSVDAVVADPPYGLSKQPDIAEVLKHWLAGDDYVHGGGGFMGRSWDSFVPGPSVWREALRVLKPGGHLLVFASTRTVDLTGIAIRLAGFEIRDTVLWLHGSGFPKSLDVSKAIDKAAGANRHVVGRAKGAASQRTESLGAYEPEYDATAPATPEAAQWEGFGTALKPSHEPIVVARKPLIGTVVENVLEHGTGALNVDACRVEMAEADREIVDRRSGQGDAGLVYGGGIGRPPGERFTSAPAGRWPPNVVLSEEAAAELDGHAGERPHSFRTSRTDSSDGLLGWRGKATLGFADSGGASRFFYCAKTARGERNAGLEGFKPVSSDELTGRDEKAPGLAGDPGNRGQTGNPYAGQSGGARHNIHPTVKPINLMRWLCRLVTPPGGLILDPFLGSGTTGCAAVLDGFAFVGVEREAEYLAIAKARIAFWARFKGRDVADVLGASAEKSNAERAEAGQLGLLP